MLTRIRKALTAIFCRQVLITVGNLLLVPLYLERWSPIVYGEWLALLALAGYLSTLDLGMNMAVANKLTQTYSRADLGDYTRWQHSAMAFYLSIAFGASVLLAIAVWGLPLPAWLGLRETSEGEASWVIWLLGLNVLWAMPVGLVSSVYRVTGNLARSQWIGNLQQLIGLGLVAVVLVLGGGMKSLAIWQLAPLLLVALYVRRRLPTLSPGVTRASLSVLRRLVKPSLLFGLLILSNVITLHGTVIVLSTVLGGLAVAIFVTSRTLVNVVRQIVGSVINSFWPEITSMEARGEWERLRLVHRFLMVGATALCIGFASAVWYEGMEIITVWTRGKLVPDLILLRLLLVLLVLQSIWVVSLVFTAAANRHEKLSWSNLISALIGVGMAAVLVKPLGTWAVPVGLIVGEAVACYHFVVKDTCLMIGEPYRPFALRLWLGFLIVAAMALLAGWATHHTIPGPYLVRWLGVGAFTSIVSAVAACVIWFTPEDRAQLMSRLRPLVVLGGSRA